MARSKRAVGAVLLVAVAACGGNSEMVEPGTARFCEIHAEIEAIRGEMGFRATATELETGWYGQLPLFEEWPQVAPAAMKADAQLELAFMLAITHVYADAGFAVGLIDTEAMRAVNREYAEVTAATDRIAEWVDDHC